MATFIHKNVWAWGRQDTIILKDGRAFCHVSIEDDNKAVAWLSNVCVLKLWRRFGFGNQLLKKAKEHAREMGAHILCLWAEPDGWVIDWYKRKGFKQSCVYDDGMIGLTFDLDDGH